MPKFGVQAYTRRGGDFRQIMKRYRHLAEDELKYVVQDACLMLADDIVKATPYRTGRAKSNWKIGINGRPEEYDRIGLASRNHRIDQSPLDAYQLGDNVHIYNKAPYIGLLESGLSDQAPAGSIVREHVDNWDIYVARAVRMNE